MYEAEGKMRQSVQSFKHSGKLVGFVIIEFNNDILESIGSLRKAILRTKKR